MPVVNIGGETGVHLQHGSVRKSKKLEKIGGEEPLLLPIEGSVLQRCLLVASLLSQFKIPKICGDYEAGLFNLPDSLQVSLEELDCFYSHLLPDWGTGHGIKSRVESAQELLTDLVNEVKHNFVFEGTNCVPKSFQWWNNFIFQLASDDYWESIGFFTGEPPQNRKKESVSVNSEIQTDPVPSKDVAVNAVTKVSCSAARCCLTTAEVTEDNTSVKPLNKVKQRSPKFIKSTSDSFCRQSQCGWCNREGHYESQCWKKLRLCLCGGNHKLVECSRFVQARFTPECSLCTGSHLGKHCTKAKPPKIYCNWCGNPGHAESHCWRKSQSCLLCGSPSHKMSQCHKFVPRDSILLPPWYCISCKEHMPDDCVSPYME